MSCAAPAEWIIAWGGLFTCTAAAIPGSAAPCRGHPPGGISLSEVSSSFFAPQQPLTAYPYGEEWHFQELCLSGLCCPNSRNGTEETLTPGQSVPELITKSL